MYIKITSLKVQFDLEKSKKKVNKSIFPVAPGGFSEDKYIQESVMYYFQENQQTKIFAIFALRKVWFRRRVIHIQLTRSVTQ